ncbi:hypothetical protein PT276_06550 [Orbaceae bacterium ESL0721]|nr:hypothetical protein [Orbaceae bacterium ESL0721]
MILGSINIFPNGVLPSIAQLSRATEGKFIMEDWQNFGLIADKNADGMA